MIGSPRQYRLYAGAIVLLAFVLRAFHLGTLPPALFYDESYNILDALHVLHDGYHPVFFAGNNGREPFFIYLQTLFVYFGGTMNPWVVRLPAVIVGTLTVALTYPLVRRVVRFEAPERREAIALLATFFLATLQWHLDFSRVGLRAISQPLFEALALYCLYRAWQGPVVDVPGSFDCQPEYPMAPEPCAKQRNYLLSFRRRPESSVACCHAHALPYEVYEQRSAVSLKGVGSAVRPGDAALDAQHDSDATALHSAWWLWFLFAGLAGGAAMYTYLSARLLPVAVALIVVADLLIRRRISRRYCLGLGVMVLGFLAAAAPLALYYLANPTIFFGHSADVSLLNFDWRNTLGTNILRVAGMFNWAGDVNWRHNLPGRPVFDLLTGLFFVLGLIVAARRVSRRSFVVGGIPARPPDAFLGYVGPAIVIAVMLLPTVLSEGAPHFLRAIGVLPFLMLFPAVGLASAARALGNRVTSRKVAGGFVVVVLLSGGGATLWSYFQDFGSRPDPYYHFDARYQDLGNFVRAQNPGVRVYLSPQLGGHATANFFLQGQSYAAFDSQRTVVLTTKEALYGFDIYGIDIPAFDAFPGQMPLAAQKELLPDRYGQRSFGFYRVPASPGLTADDLLAKAALSALEWPIGWQESAKLLFGDRLGLLGFQMPDAGQPGAHEIDAGASVPVTLVWYANQPVGDDLTVSLRLIDKNGRTWAQSDSLAGGQVYPSHFWQPEEVVIDRPALTLPADAPPGEYRLAAAVYSLANNRKLEPMIAGRSQGDLATLSAVKIVRPAAGALAAMHPPSVLNTTLDNGRITLLGYGLGRDSLRAGESLDLDLFWKAEQQIAEDLRVNIKLVDGEGTTVAELAESLGGGYYPTPRWRQGDALRDGHRLIAAASATPGPTRLRISLLDVAGQTRGEVTVDGPTLADRPHDYSPPSPKFPVHAKFGDLAELLGFDAEGSPGQLGPQVRPGSDLPVTLYWRALAANSTSYTVFVQVLDAAGRLVAQHDGLPQDGGAPTSGWLPNEIVADRHVVPLGAALPAGDYQLIVGLYNVADGKRLAAPRGDFATLATLRLTALLIR